MYRIAAIVFFLLNAAVLQAQTTTLSFSDADFQVTPVFNDVGTFSFDIEINTALAPGVYINPDIVSLSYAVSGVLTQSTPSGFASFALQRDMDGAEFYAQGSSLSFEVSQNAVLGDGVQIAELVGSAIVFTFNGRENGNGRFHPALVELNADGTGQIQNSDNIIVDIPLEQINFGDEYVTTLMFDAGNTTLLSETPVPPPPPAPPRGGSGSSSLAGVALLCFAAFFVCLLRVRRLRVRVLSRNSSELWQRSNRNYP